MADQTEKPKLGTRPPLGIKRTVETGKVKQSFSHGRSNTVVVERKQRRVFTKPGEAPPPRRPSPLPKRRRPHQRRSLLLRQLRSRAGRPRPKRSRNRKEMQTPPSPRGGGSPHDRARGCAPPRGTSQEFEPDEEERRRAEENRRDRRGSRRGSRLAELQEEALAATAPPPSEDAEPAAVSVPRRNRGAQLPPSCGHAPAPKRPEPSRPTPRSRRSPPFWGSSPSAAPCPTKTRAAPARSPRSVALAKRKSVTTWRPVLRPSRSGT